MSFPISGSTTATFPVSTGYTGSATATSTGAYSASLSTDSMTIGSIGGTIGSGIGGGVAAFFSASKIAGAFKGAKEVSVAARAAKAADAGGKIGMMTKVTGGVRGILGGFKAALPSILRGTGIGAAVSGVVSAGINGFRLSQGEITGKQFAGEVAADTVAGAISSMGAMAVGAAVVGVAATFLGGLPLTILGVGAGIAGALLTDKLVEKVGIKDGIRNMISGDSTVTPTGGDPTTGGGTGPTPPGNDF